MSFSLVFTAASKAHAKKLLEQRGTYVPDQVKGFIRAAIDGLQGADGVRLIKVHAIGHLASSSGDYAVSSAEISVTPIVADD